MRLCKLGVTAVIFHTARGASSQQASGRAIVQNSCVYDIHLDIVPSAHGGQQARSRWLSHGQAWEQHFTSLTNSGGWSIKISKEPASGDTLEKHVMQYEYTYTLRDPDTIWFDLSEVNGDPWPLDFTFTSPSAGCQPAQQVYRYPSDNARAEQSCPSTADIVVNLCSRNNVTKQRLSLEDTRKSSAASAAGTSFVRLQASEARSARQSSSRYWSVNSSASPQPSQLISQTLRRPTTSTHSSVTACLVSRSSSLPSHMPAWPSTILGDVDQIVLIEQIEEV